MKFKIGDKVKLIIPKEVAGFNDLDNGKDAVITFVREYDSLCKINIIKSAYVDRSLWVLTGWLHSIETKQTSNAYCTCNNQIKKLVTFNTFKFYICNNCKKEIAFDAEQAL
jgi:hypothetical protein